MLRISKDIEITNIIGKGSYGDVYIGKKIKSNEIYGIKKIAKKQIRIRNNLSIF